MVILKCPQCFTQSELGTPACPSCGFPFESLSEYVLEQQELQKPKEDAAASPPEPQPAKTEPPPQIPEIPKHDCESCGNPVADNIMFCTVCGQRSSKAPRPIIQKKKKKKEKPTTKGTISFFLLTGSLFAAFLVFSDIMKELEKRPLKGIQRAPIGRQASVKPNSAKDILLGRYLNFQAYQLIRQHRYEDAVPLLQRALQMFPKGIDHNHYAFTLYTLGYALRMSGRAKEAIPFLEARLKMDGENAMVRKELEAARQSATLQSQVRY